VFQQSFESALDYFKIREMQSEWYMDLFQSGREPWQDPYPYIWKTYAKMFQWFQDMPSTVLPAIRSFFELELLYSYVYMLSPSPRVPHIHEYAQRLIFEHCIAYATNLLALISQPSLTTKPPITFYDAMRAYMTGRQFVDVLSRNLDVILDPVPPTPPAPSAPPSTSEDPLAPPAPVSAPPFPTPVIPDGQSGPQNPTQRAINAINDFTDILSRFGLRFGFTHWRDRFQRESGALLSQLYHRASQSPAQTPPSQGMPTFFTQSWLPATSPQQQSYHQQNPTTPPSAYPPQPSPFSTSPFNASPFSAPNQNQQQPMQDWTSPSPQPPDMPQPTEGRVRQALILGPGIPQPAQGQDGTPEGRFM
jgi:hypothetical protein